MRCDHKCVVTLLLKFCRNDVGFESWDRRRFIDVESSSPSTIFRRWFQVELCVAYTLERRWNRRLYSVEMTLDLKIERRLFITLYHCLSLHRNFKVVEFTLSIRIAIIIILYYSKWQHIHIIYSNLRRCKKMKLTRLSANDIKHNTKWQHIKNIQNYKMYKAIKPIKLFKNQCKITAQSYTVKLTKDLVV